MNAFILTAHFGDEVTSYLDFKAQRDKQGIVCRE